MARSSSRETAKPYNVFLSWSGKRSLYVAQFFHGWLQKVLQRAKPWLSDRDIDKGTVGVDEIQKALSGMQVGIFFLTPENRESVWMPYEAGSLTNEINDKTRICTYLLDGLQIQHVRGPFGMFQHTRPDCEETRKLVHTINKVLDGEVLSDAIVDSVFDKWWPELSSHLDKMPQNEGDSKPLPKPDEMLAEILEHKEIQRLHEKIQKQHEENQKLVNEVLLSLSTRYTKTRFPDYLGEVAELVSRSKRDDELLIIVDYVGTGHYSWPEGFMTYFEAIMSASARKIRMLVYGEEAAKEVFQRQFKKKLDGTIEPDEHFSKYFAFFGIQIQTGYEDFLNALARKHGDFCEAFSGARPKIEIRVLSPPSMREGFWFWMIRDKQMVFASPSFAEVTNRGLAFFTSDNPLMQVFLDRFEDRWRQSIELDFDAKTSGWPRRVEKLFSADPAVGPSSTK